MFGLVPALQRYSWGSTHAIQEFAAAGDAGVPLAEIWYGSHAAGPSRLPDGRTLESMIAADPHRLLGTDVAMRFDGSLPFLVKLLAPGRAVSLQVHPSAARAAVGFAAEASAPAAARKFVDGNHKPELIFALTPFEGLVGLRPVEDIVHTLSSFALPVVQAALDALRPGDQQAIRRAVVILASATPKDVALAVAHARRLASEGSAAAATLLELEEQYPGDAGTLVSLMLRRVLLDPGDSVTVHSGVPHAYLSGLALEVMANSDNVFRLGLTAKHVDVDESVANLITRPALLSQPHTASASADVQEFRLDVYDHVDTGTQLPAPGPKILVALSDHCDLELDDDRLRLRRGGAAFVSHDEAPTVTGSGRFAVISVPGS